jgi:hypothetical protein
MKQTAKAEKQTARNSTELLDACTRVIARDAPVKFIMSGNYGYVGHMQPTQLADFYVACVSMKDDPKYNQDMREDAGKIVERVDAELGKASRLKARGINREFASKPAQLETTA